MSGTDAAYEKWAAKERAYRTAHWEHHRLHQSEQERAEFEESISPTSRAWISAREQIEERARLLPGKFLASVPRRAGEIAMSAESIGVIAEVDAWYERTKKAGGILVLSGLVGTGKTVAACRVSWMRMVDDYGPYSFTRAADLAMIGRYGEEREALLKCTHMIVDDLAAEYLDKSGSFLVDLDHLVDITYSNRRHMVITTNLGRARFAERYGQRITDRLNECGTWITVTGESRRRKP